MTDHQDHPAGPTPGPAASGAAAREAEAGAGETDRDPACQDERAARPRRAPAFPEATLSVVGWPDPVLDQLGHDPRSAYVERFWLPVLGPSCLLLIRRLAAELERRPDGFEVDSAQWAGELGIGMKGGQHGPFWRAVERTCRFGAARRNGPRLALRRRLPPLSTRQVQRLPESLQGEHDQWVAARLEQPRRATVTRWTPRPGPGSAPAGPPPSAVEFDDAA